MGVISILLSFSLITLYNISSHLFWSQFLWAIFLIVIVFLTSKLNWRTLINYKWLVFGIYGTVIILLLIALFFSRPIRGTNGWITIGPPDRGVQFQPAELMKVALIILYAQYFSRKHLSVANLRTIFATFLYFLAPALIILKQPDLGSAFIVFGIWFGFLLVSGLPFRKIVASLLIFAFIAGISWQLVLRPYQKDRIVGFLFPEHDPLGINYNVTQSKIAIGSGGWFGKGFGQGTQVQLGFLPEAHTDFIFATFVEEWGALGGLFLIVGLGYVVFRIIKIGMMSEENFGRFVSIGTAIMILIQSFLNIGFNLGILPVVGIPLPFLSYGGSHLLTTALLIGIIQNIAKER